MSPLLEQFQAWLAQKPPEPSVMAPVGSRARLASDTQAERESRMDVLHALGMLPVPGAQALYAAGDLAGEAETTPLGVAKAAAGAIMPVKSGPGKINVMGEASRVAPDVLRRIQHALASGKSAKEAYQSENALPLVHAINQPVQDAWIPVMPANASLTSTKLAEFRRMRADPDARELTMGGRFGELFRPQDLETIGKHYPELLDTKVVLQATDPGGSGSFNPRRGIEVDAFSVFGPQGVVPILGHEGTHAIQSMRGLPPGYSDTAVVKDYARLLHRAELAGETGTSADKQAINEALSTALSLPPGTEALPSPYKEASPEVQNLIRALAWWERAEKQTGGLKISEKLYRAYHGEQAAEGSRQWLSGQTPHFTTPLAKQIFTPEAIAKPHYSTRLQHLYNLKERGFFDPTERPYELPPQFLPATK